MTEAAYMKLRLLEADIPEERILCEENSRNTTQNAENILELINKHLSNLERPVVSVVTGGFHMRRVFRDFGCFRACIRFGCRLFPPMAIIRARTTGIKT